MAITNNKLSTKTAALLGLLTVAGISSTYAATATSTDPLSITLTANQLVMQNGQSVLKPVTKANSGDTIQYTAAYRNNIEKPMTDVVITLPVPVNMVYTSNSTPAPVQASLDGAKFEAIPIKRLVNGKMVEVPTAQYRALRWVVKYLPAQKEATVTMNTKVR